MTYGTQYGSSITNVRNVAQGLRVASHKSITNAHGRRRYASASVYNCRADNVSIQSVVSASLEHKGVRLPIEHILVDSLDVFLLGIVPDLALGVEVARGSKIDKIAAAADMNQFTLSVAVLDFLSSDDSRNQITSERAASVHGYVVFRAKSGDFCKITEVPNDDAVGLEVRCELAFGLCAANICSHLPVWVRLLDGPGVWGFGIRSVCCLDICESVRFHVHTTNKAGGAEDYHRGHAESLSRSRGLEES